MASITITMVQLATISFVNIKRVDTILRIADIDLFLASHVDLSHSVSVWDFGPIIFQEVVRGKDNAGRQRPVKLS